MNTSNLSYWLPPSGGRKCKNCGKKLAKRARRTNTGYCHACRLKLAPPALGKKRPDMVGNKYTVIKYGKDNYFGKVKFKGRRHALWKGSDVGYSALHSWLQREFGEPTVCEFCGKKGLEKWSIHWANKSGKYLRKRSDWIRLCAKCHWHYDRNKKHKT